MPSIQMRGVHVRYPVFTSGSQESLFANIARRATFGALGKARGQGTIVHALRGIDLSIKEGDRLGIVGRNGSGKTTLLKTLAGLNWPQEGLFKVDGHVNSIINLGAGLDGERTGFENIEYVTKLHGINQKGRKVISADIEEFSELGEFLNLPIRTYSSGMMLRLSFGLATALPGEILVVDEVLAAGDAHFHERAKARIEAVMEKAPIVILATHSGHTLETFTNRAICLQSGKIVKEGDPKDVWDFYEQQP